MLVFLGQAAAFALPGSHWLESDGASDRPSILESLHATSQARALSLLVDELGLRSFAVVGHDFGGPVAITLLGMRGGDITALGLLATNVFPDTPIPFRSGW